MNVLEFTALMPTNFVVVPPPSMMMFGEPVIVPVRKIAPPAVVWNVAALFKAILPPNV